MKLTTTTSGPEPRSRFARVPAFGLAAVLAAAGLAVVPGTAQASTSTTLAPQTFTAASTSLITVPANATSVHLVGLGGAGRDGGSAPSNYGAGGAGGHGTQVSVDVPIGSDQSITPGSTLTVVVGAVGGGGPGGAPQDFFGAPEGGFGGAGGGATTVSANGTVVLIAGGGGGGGGGGNSFHGGDGGTLGAGNSTSIDGTIAARGGAHTQTCASPFQLQLGEGGETNGTAYNLGGGGGGGGQGCSPGGGGGSGDHGAGRALDGAGGGGGGAGTSGAFGADGAITPGDNTGDGSASITFTVDPTGDGPYSTTVTVSPPSIRFGDQATITLTPVLDVTGAPVPDPPTYIEVFDPNGNRRFGCQGGLTCDFDSGGPGFTTGNYQVEVWVGGQQVAATSFVIVPPLVATTTTLTTPAPLTSGGGTVQATVRPSSSNPLIPTGTVTFTDGTTTLCGGPVGLPSETPDGTGIVFDCRLDTVTAGQHQYSATYSGDDHFAASTSSPLTEQISPPVTAPAPLVITTSGSLPAGTVGTPYTAGLSASGGTGPCEWALAPGSGLPAGLTLRADGTIVGTPTAAWAGTVTVQAIDAATPAQTAATMLNLAIAPAPTTTSLSSSADPALRRQPITLTARVTAPAGAPVPTGRVRFADGAKVLATVTLGRSGVATFTTRSLAVGSHPLTATYVGNAAEQGSASAPLPQVVQRVTPTALAAQASGYVQASSAFTRLSPAGQRAALTSITSATAQLAGLTGQVSTARKTALINAYDEAVRAAQSRRYLTAAQAASLIAEAGTL